MKKNNLKYFFQIFMVLLFLLNGCVIHRESIVEKGNDHEYDIDIKSNRRVEGKGDIWDTTIVMDNGLIDGKGFNRWYKYSFNIIIEMITNEPPEYFLSIFGETSDEIRFHHEGQSASLFIRADTIEKKFIAKHEYFNKNEYSGITDYSNSALYALSLNELRLIANSKQVLMTILAFKNPSSFIFSQEGYIDFYLSKEQISNIRHFVNKYSK